MSRFSASLMAGILLAVLQSPATAQPPDAAKASAETADTPVRRGSAFTQQNLVGSTIWTSETTPGWVPAGGSVLDFVDDGTGVSYETLFFFGELGDPATIPKTFTWTITNGVLDIVFDDFAQISFPFISYPYDELADIYGYGQDVVDFMNTAFENSQFFDGQVEMTRHTMSRTSTVLSGQGERFLTATSEIIEHSMDDQLTTLGWQGPLPRGTETNDNESLVYLNSEITNGLQGAPAAGDTWAVPFIYSPLDPRLTEPSPDGWYIDVLSLDVLGGTSAGQLSDETYQWSATADGLVLDAGPERYTYTPIETDGYVYFTFVTYSFNGEVQLRSAQWVARDDGTGANFAADLVQPIPLYWQSGLNLQLLIGYDENGRLLPSFTFGYSLAGDGTSFRIFGGGDECLTDEFDPCYSAEGEPLWTWTANGNDIFRDREQNADFFRTRAWTVLSYQPGGRAVVMEWGVWQFLPDPWSFVIQPRINTLELLDLSDWPEAWADADGFYAPDDEDGDGIADAADNCMDYATTDLRDGDGDGIGTACDPDHNQDCTVNFGDLALFYQNFLGDDDNYDYSGDGFVNFVDFARFKQLFFTGASPGPGVSGVPNVCDP